MDTHKKSWETYARSWSENDIEKRKALYVEALDQGFCYTDPNTATLKGYDALSAYMDQFQKMVLGGGFEITGYEFHHDRSIASWNMVDGNKNILGQRKSFARYTPLGKLLEEVGFFTLPQA